MPGHSVKFRTVWYVICDIVKLLAVLTFISCVPCLDAIVELPKCCPGMEASQLRDSLFDGTGMTGRTENSDMTASPDEWPSSGGRQVRCRSIC